MWIGDRSAQKCQPNTSDTPHCVWRCWLLSYITQLISKRQMPQNPSSHIHKMCLIQIQLSYDGHEKSPVEWVTGGYSSDWQDHHWESEPHTHTPVRKARHHYHLSFHDTYYLCMRHAFEALNIYIPVAARKSGNWKCIHFFLFQILYTIVILLTKKKNPTLIVSRCFFRAHGVFFSVISVWYAAIIII